MKYYHAPRGEKPETLRLKFSRDKCDAECACHQQPDRKQPLTPPTPANNCERKDKTQMKYNSRDAVLRQGLYPTCVSLHSVFRPPARHSAAINIPFANPACCIATCPHP